MRFRVKLHEKNEPRRFSRSVMTRSLASMRLSCNTHLCVRQTDHGMFGQSINVWRAQIPLNQRKMPCRHGILAGFELQSSRPDSLHEKAPWLARSSPEYEQNCRMRTRSKHKMNLVIGFVGEVWPRERHCNVIGAAPRHCDKVRRANHETARTTPLSPREPVLFLPSRHTFGRSKCRAPRRDVEGRIERRRKLRRLLQSAQSAFQQHVGQVEAPGRAQSTWRVCMSTQRFDHIQGRLSFRTAIDSTGPFDGRRRRSAQTRHDETSTNRHIEECIEVDRKTEAFRS